jgi:hypothetical protein
MPSGEYAMRTPAPRVAGGLLSLLLPSFLSAGCDRSGPAVEIIVPTGFTGPVWVVEDPQGGIPIPKVGGCYRVEIPESGILKVSSTAPFRRWHSESARYADGTTLARADEAEPPDGAVALRDGGSVLSSRGGREVRFLSYYVGTKKAAKAFLEMPTLPPG